MGFSAELLSVKSVEDQERRTKQSLVPCGYNVQRTARLHLDTTERIIVITLSRQEQTGAYVSELPGLSYPVWLGCLWLDLLNFVLQVAVGRITTVN